MVPRLQIPISTGAIQNMPEKADGAALESLTI